MKKKAEQFEGRPPLVWAVVVTYQPDITLLDNLRGLIAQFNAVIIVDNGSCAPAAQIVDAAEKLPGVWVIRNGKNLGIAAALNTGIRRALDAGCTWVATFDQDTCVSENYRQGLFDARVASPFAERVGMIVPGCSFSSRSAVIAPTASPAFAFVQGAITSGSLISAEAFSTAGPYDEEMFIDYVDTEFCLRLQKKAFLILSATNVGIIHELGTAQTRNVFGWRLRFRIHAAWRYYYIMRNRILLFRRYGLVFPLWVLRDATRMLLELGRIACLEKDRLPKLRCAAHGIWDGLRGKSGRHPNFP